MGNGAYWVLLDGDGTGFEALRSERFSHFRDLFAYYEDEIGFYNLDPMSILETLFVQLVPELQSNLFIHLSHKIRSANRLQMRTGIINFSLRQNWNLDCSSHCKHSTGLWLFGIYELAKSLFTEFFPLSIYDIYHNEDAGSTYQQCPYDKEHLSSDRMKLLHMLGFIYRICELFPDEEHHFDVYDNDEAVVLLLSSYFANEINPAFLNIIPKQAKITIHHYNVDKKTVFELPIEARGRLTGVVVSSAMAQRILQFFHNKYIANHSSYKRFINKVYRTYKGYDNLNDVKIRDDLLSSVKLPFHNDRGQDMLCMLAIIYAEILDEITFDDEKKSDDMVEAVGIQEETIFGFLANTFWDEPVEQNVPEEFQDALLDCHIEGANYKV
ncbi:MAG: hypothetical protein ACE365_07735 [Gammaproteobacteria bacterium]